MKTALCFFSFLAAAMLLHVSGNDLLPDAPPGRTHVQDVADRIKLDSKAFVEITARRVEANIRACWADPQHTPQQFLDQFGSKAAASLNLNRQAAELVTAYEQTTGLTILDRAVLALVGNVTVNPDGTVTVSP